MTKHRIFYKNNLLITLITASSLIFSLTPLQVKAQSKPFKIGVVEGVLPCSGYESGRWNGIAVEFWEKVAEKVHMPYQLVPEKSTGDLLKNTKQGNIDLGIGCISLSPQRVNQYSFTVPFKEDGVAVISHVKSLDVGSAMIKALFSQYLINLFLGFILVMTIFGLVLTILEKNRDIFKKLKTEDGKSSIIKYLVSMITGAGINSYAETNTGNSLLLLAHFIRMVFGSLIVSYITVNVVKQNQEVSNLKIVRPTDLAGLKVSVRSGSISEDLLKDTNKQLLEHGESPITVFPSANLSEAFKLLVDSKVDAMMGDNAQLQYLKKNSKISKGLAIGMQDTLIQSQGFTISPNISLQTRMAINFVIADLKQQGAVKEISKEWLGEEGKGK
jgi:polar amino acid transport system substrate-binding protein